MVVVRSPGGSAPWFYLPSQLVPPPPPPQGSTVIWAPVTVTKQRINGSVVEEETTQPTILHVDIIRQPFWDQYPHLLE